MPSLNRYLNDLLTIAQSAGPDECATLLESADAMLTQPSRLSEEEQQTTSKLAQTAYGRLSLDHRLAVAEQLARGISNVRILIELCAGDRLEIAAPMLETAPSIDDDILIDIARRHHDDRLISIARRRNLSAAVAEELVHIGTVNHLGTELAKNLTAQISDRAWSVLTSAARLEPELRLALAFRPDLNRDVGVALGKQGSERLSTYIQSRLPRLLSSRFPAPRRSPDHNLLRALHRRDLATFYGLVAEALGMEPAAAQNMLEPVSISAVEFVGRSLGLETSRRDVIWHLLRRAQGHPWAPGPIQQDHKTSRSAISADEGFPEKLAI